MFSEFPIINLIFIIRKKLFKKMWTGDKVMALCPCKCLSSWEWHLPITTRKRLLHGGLDPTCSKILSALIADDIANWVISVESSSLEELGLVSLAALYSAGGFLMLEPHCDSIGYSDISSVFTWDGWYNSKISETTILTVMSRAWICRWEVFVW